MRFPITFSVRRFLYKINYLVESIRRRNMKATTHMFFLRMGNILGFVPWINFERNVLVNKKWTKIYPGLIALAVFLEFGLMTDMHMNSILVATVDTAIFFTATYGTYSKGKYWQKWIKLYEVTNTKLRMKFDETLDLNWGIILIFLFYATLWPFMQIFHVFDDQKNINWSGILVTNMRVFAECLPILFLTTLSKGFRILNRYSENLNFEDDTRIIVVATKNRTNALLYKNLYKNLANMSACFNELFRWLFATCLVEFLILMTAAMNLLINFKYENKLDSTNISVISIFFVSEMVSTLSIFIYILIRFSVAELN